MTILKEFPEEKEKVIEEYERLSQLYKQDRHSFENEIQTAFDVVINEAENVKRKSNLLKLQVKLNKNLQQAYLR